MVLKAPFFCRYWYDHPYRQYYWHLKRLRRALQDYPAKTNPDYLKVRIFLNKNNFDELIYNNLLISNLLMYILPKYINFLTKYLTTSR